MDKRNFTRVDYTECASVKHDDQVFFCDIKSISLQGMFVKTTQEIPLNSPVEITIYHPPDDSFRFYADVVYFGENGLGMRIKRMDVQSFVHLRDVVAMQCNDNELITRETYRVTSCIS